MRISDWSSDVCSSNLPDEKVIIWSALGSLAGAPVEQRTLTGLSVLLQSNALRQALAPYVLGGAHGKLLDADTDRLGFGDVQGFEMEELMHSPAAVQAVLRSLFARFGRSEEHTSELP